MGFVGTKWFGCRSCRHQGMKSTRHTSHQEGHVTPHCWEQDKAGCMLKPSHPPWVGQVGVSQALERLFHHPEPTSGLNLYIHVSTYPCKSYPLLQGSFTSFNSLFKCSGFYIFIESYSFKYTQFKGHVEWLFHPPGHSYPSTSCQIKVPTRPSGVRVVTAGSANTKRISHDWRTLATINFHAVTDFNSL